MRDQSQIHAVRAYREQLLNDPYRPRYHFAIPDDDGRPGDPNGCFFADGVHHMMYLYRRDGDPFHWGHVSSRDLLHWRHHGDSLIKGEMDDGCFSGGAFVDDDGTAYLSYWIFNDGKRTKGHNAGIGLAQSRPPYEHWERIPDAVISSTEWGIRDVTLEDGQTLHLGCADPSNIWKEDGIYYMQLGNLCVLNEYGRKPDSPEEYRGDWTDLFSSADLRNWKYEGRFYQRQKDNIWTDTTEDDMCPSYLPLPMSPTGGQGSGKMLQLFIAHNKGCQYYIGRQEGLRFLPESHGRMSWRDNAFFAPEAYMDGQGRQIMFAWLLDNLDHDFQTYGWSGVFSLPRTLWLRSDETLGMAPVSELRALRSNEQILSLSFPPASADGTNSSACTGHALPIHTPDCCEIILSFEGHGMYKAGLALRSGDGEVLIYYDSTEGALVMDLTRSGSPVRAICESAPLTLQPGEALTLDVFIDRSVLEVFALDHQAICRRVYFSNPDELSIFTLCVGDVKPTAIHAWEIAPTNPY